MYAVQGHRSFRSILLCLAESKVTKPSCARYINQNTTLFCELVGSDLFLPKMDCESRILTFLEARMETIWVFRLSSLLVMGFGFSLAVFLLIPKSVKYFSSWKQSRNEKHLTSFFMDLSIAVFLILAVFSVIFKRVYEYFAT